MVWRPAPLNSSFMLTSILGFVIAAIWVYDKSVSWAVTFMIFFACMFIASIISMSYAPVPRKIN